VPSPGTSRTLLLAGTITPWIGLERRSGRALRATTAFNGRLARDNPPLHTPRRSLIHVYRTCAGVADASVQVRPFETGAPGAPRGGATACTASRDRTPRPPLEASGFFHDDP